MAVGVGNSPMINVMMGRCVGGSSVMTGGVCFRTPEAVLADWEMAKDQLQFVKDRIEEQFNLGRHADTITEDELITMQAFAVDLVYT